MRSAIRGPGPSVENCHRHLYLGPMALLADLLILGSPHGASPSTLLAAKAAEQPGEAVPSPWCEPFERLLLVVHGFCGRDWAEWNSGIDEDE